VKYHQACIERKNPDVICIILRFKQKDVGLSNLRVKKKNNFDPEQFALEQIKSNLTKSHIILLMTKQTHQMHHHEGIKKM